jgi:hypothetical protein
MSLSRITSLGSGGLSAALLDKAAKLKPQADRHDQTIIISEVQNEVADFKISACRRVRRRPAVNREEPSAEAH